LRCTTYDQPVVAPIAERSIAAAGLSEPGHHRLGRLLHRCAGPKADVITMGHVLHDWNLDRKRQLISAAYDALARRGSVQSSSSTSSTTPDATQRLRADDVAEHADPLR